MEETSIVVCCHCSLMWNKVTHIINFKREAFWRNFEVLVIQHTAILIEVWALVYRHWPRIYQWGRFSPAPGLLPSGSVPGGHTILHIVSNISISVSVCSTHFRFHSLTNYCTQYIIPHTHWSSWAFQLRVLSETRRPYSRQFCTKGHCTSQLP